MTIDTVSYKEPYLGISHFTPTTSKSQDFLPMILLSCLIFYHSQKQATPSRSQILQKCNLFWSNLSISTFHFHFHLEYSIQVGKLIKVNVESNQLHWTSCICITKMYWIAFLWIDKETLDSRSGITGITQMSDNKETSCHCKYTSHREDLRCSMQKQVLRLTHRKSQCSNIGIYHFIPCTFPHSMAGWWRFPDVLHCHDGKADR